VNTSDYLRQRIRHRSVTGSHERFINARRKYRERKAAFREWVIDPESIEEYTEAMWADEQVHPKELPEDLKELLRRVDDRF